MDPEMRNREVNRAVVDQVRLVDPNNNQPNNHLPVEPVQVGFAALPPVTTAIALLQIFLYGTREYFNIKSEEDVYVSWKTVMTGGQYWRLVCAQYFHFSRVHLFLNFCALMSIGRYLEKKIQSGALMLIIQLMGTVSNLLYIILNSFFCTGTANENTFGFTSSTYALRILVAYVQEPRNYELALAFGLNPLELPAIWAPWQPVMEVIVLWILISIPDICFLASWCGIIVGFLISFGILIVPTRLIYSPDAADED